MQNILDDAVYKILSELLSYKKEFVILVKNNNNWEKPLPERLQNISHFMVKVEGNTLEDSYETDDGYVCIVTDFDGVLNNIILTDYDIQGIYMPDLETPIIVKPYTIVVPESVMQPKVKNKLKMPSLTEAGVQHSIAVFKEYNPNLFKENK